MFEIYGAGGGGDTYAQGILITRRDHFSSEPSKWIGRSPFRALKFKTLHYPPLDKLTSSLDWFKLLLPLETIAQNPRVSRMKGNFRFQFKI